MASFQKVNSSNGFRYIYLTTNCSSSTLRFLSVDYMFEVSRLRQHRRIRGQPRHRQRANDKRIRDSTDKYSSGRYMILEYLSAISHTTDRTEDLQNDILGCCAAQTWIGLPEDVTMSPTLPIFRKRLETHLFCQSYPDITYATLKILID